MLSSKEDHQHFVLLIKRSPLFPSIEDKIGNLIVNAGKCSKPSCEDSFKDSKAKHTNEALCQEVFNRSSSDEDS